MRERSRSYVTEERAKSHWQDLQKQSNMNFRQALMERLRLTLSNKKAVKRRRFTAFLLV